MNWNEYGGIVAASNAIRAKYHLEVYHEPDEEMMKWFSSHSFTNIICLLIDALGSSIIQNHLRQNSFLRSHLLKNTTTVFPPTTAAATTAFRTGKYPMETGWLGWNQYFQEKDDNIILLLNRSQYGDRIYPGYSYEALPVSFITDELKDRAAVIWPAWGRADNTFDSFLERVRRRAENRQLNFIYGYWDQLDSLMHQYGPSSLQAEKMVEDIDKKLGLFATSLPSDWGLIVLADHSQIDVTHACMPSRLTRYFAHPPALEPRTTSFYIQNGHEEEFRKTFENLYGNAFHLYTHEDVIQSHMFGKGTPCGRFEEFIGDYLSIASGNIQLLYGSKKYSLGDHAGGLDEEAYIPLVVFAK